MRSLLLSSESLWRNAFDQDELLPRVPNGVPVLQWTYLLFGPANCYVYRSIAPKPIFDSGDIISRNAVRVIQALILYSGVDSALAVAVRSECTSSRNLDVNEF